MNDKKYILNFLKEADADYLPGGKAYNKPDSDFPKKQLDKGIEAEMEHTDDKELAKEIAKDHLEGEKETGKEKKDLAYYDKLEQMEDDLKKNASSFETFYEKMWE